MASNHITRKINLSLALLFASGALLTTAVVHIIPEAIEQLALEHPDDLHDVFLRSGTTVMAGILLGFLLHVALDNGSGHSHSAEQLQLLPVLGKGGNPGGTTESTTPAREGDNSDGCRSGDGGNEEAALRKRAFGNDDGHPTDSKPVAVKPLSSEVPNINHECVGAGDQISGRGSCSGSGRGAAVTAEDSRACAGVAEPEEDQWREPRPDDPVEATVFGGKRGIAARLHCVGSDGMGEVAAGAVVKSRRKDGIGKGMERGLFDVAELDPICWNVIVGDFAHNFSDGVTMAAAFLGCSSTVGWTITAANMMHEIPHELGNFMALVNGGMSVKQASFALLKSTFHVK